MPYPGTLGGGGGGRVSTGGAGVTVTVPSAACLTALTCLSSDSDPVRKTSPGRPSLPGTSDGRIDIDNENSGVRSSLTEISVIVVIRLAGTLPGIPRILIS